jgi:hypothetical protein
MRFPQTQLSSVGCSSLTNECGPHKLSTGNNIDHSNAALMPVFIHTWFASSMQLCVGPVAITSLIYGDTLTPLFPQIDFDNPAKDPMMPQYIAVVLQVQPLCGDMFPHLRIHLYGPVDQQVCWRAIV